MDHMVINSNFLKNIISKIIKKEINKKLGINVDLSFNSPIEVCIVDDTASLRLDISAEMPKNDISTIIGSFI